MFIDLSIQSNDSDHIDVTNDFLNEFVVIEEKMKALRMGYSESLTICDGKTPLAVGNISSENFDSMDQYRDALNTSLEGLMDSLKEKLKSAIPKFSRWVENSFGDLDRKIKDMDALIIRLKDRKVDSNKLRKTVVLGYEQKYVKEFRKLDSLAGMKELFKLVQSTNDSDGTHAKAILDFGNKYQDMLGENIANKSAMERVKRFNTEIGKLDYDEKSIVELAQWCKKEYKSHLDVKKVYENEVKALFRIMVRSNTKLEMVQGEDGGRGVIGSRDPKIDQAFKFAEKYAWATIRRYIDISNQALAMLRHTVKSRTEDT